MMINATGRDLSSLAMRLSRQSESCQVMSVELPPDCSPCRCRVGFEEHGGTGVIFVDKGIAYRGGNAEFRRFLSEGSFSYREEDELDMFLRQLDAAVAEGARSTGAASDPDSEAEAADAGSDAGIGRIALFDQRAFEDCMKADLIGQDRVVGVLSSMMAGAVRKVAPARPLALVFAGETGVGKTLAARCLPRALSEATGESFGLLRIDMNQLGERHSTTRLYGAPPGYIGYDDPPLFAPIAENPRQVILFDEMEKADPGVMYTLMNAMSEGRIEASRADEDGRRAYDLAHCILVFTTNCRFDTDPGLPQSDITELCKSEMRTRFGTLRFPPEIVARFSEVLLFQPISGEARNAIARLSLVRLGKEFGLSIEDVDDGIIEEYCSRCGPEGGVRSFEYMAERLFGKAMADCLESRGESSFEIAGTVEEPEIRIARGR